MIKHLKVNNRIIPIVLLFVLSILLRASPLFAATGNEVISSYQPEYMQGDTAYIFGSGFQPNHQIVVQVIRVDSSIVTGNGTETPGSDIITSDLYGSFIYPYLLDGGTTAQYYGTLTVNAIDSVTLTTLATTTFLDNPQVGLQGCSREKGDCTQSATPLTGWADGTNPMNGWTSGNVKGWYELEDVPYRLRINPRESSDAKNYYFTVEHDNLQTGVTGVDSASGFYVGAGPDMSGYTQGILTKNCVFQSYRLAGDNPTTSKPCIVTGPYYSGVDDDGNNGVDEDPPDGINNDGDTKVDEDPPPTSSTGATRRLQYVVAVLFTPSEVGHDKKWAIYWKAHLAAGSSNFPGSSLHAHTSIGGNQDVPIMNVLASQQADLSITKTDSPDPVTAGGTLTYSITVHNNGPGSAKNVSVTDALPGSVTLISAIPSSGSCSGTSTITCDLGTITNGSSVTISIDVTPNTAGTISNIATVSTTTADPNSGNNTASASTTVNPNPGNNADLSINKTASPDPVVASGALTYTITVTNLGPGAASNVTVTDNLPGGVTNINASGSGWNCVMSGYLVTCTRTALSVGAAPVITITVNAPSSGGALSNTASVTATQNDPVSSNNTTTISTTVNASANLSITKTAFPNPVTAGGILTYTVTVANAGPSTATNVIVTDTLPAGTTYLGGSGTGWTCTNPIPSIVTCSRASLGVATAPAITISVTAPSNGGNISNTASVSGTEADPNTGNNNTGSVVTGVTASADLSITKTDSPDPVYAGQNLTYIITVTNNGPSTANNVTVTDTLPGSVTLNTVTPSQGSCTGLSCNLGNLADNASATVTIVVTPGTTSPINNIATVTTTTNDPNSGNNSASASTTVNPSADLSIMKTGPATVTAGGALTYTLAVTNNGPSTAVNVSVSDTLPSGVTYSSATGTGWTCNPPSGGVVTCTRGSLAVGAAQAITIIGTAPAAAGMITNSATVSSSSTYDPPTPANNTSSVSTTVTASTDLSITKTASPNPVSAGGTLTYTITVLNSGPSTATDVTVTDTLPGSVTLVSATPSQGAPCTGTSPMSCNLGTLTNGASATVTIIVTPNTAGTISNTASVNSGTTDPNSSNNTTPVVNTTVDPPPTIDADISITKTGSPATVTAAGTLTYTISVSNAGPNPATNVTVTDTLPSGVSNISAGGTGWGCSVSGLLVSCTQTSLAVGAAPNIIITVKAPTEGGSISNTASVTATENDPVPSNNNTLLSPVITTVNASSDLTITKTGTATVTAGGTITYTVTAVNNGPSTATGVQVTDNLPAGVGFISASGGVNWTCSQSAGIVTCNLASGLSVGSTPAITITVTAPTTGGSITNNASVSGSVPDPNTLNNSASASTTVNAQADLMIIFNIDAPDPVNAGANLTYTITVKNNGPSTAASLTVTDYLPPGATYVSANGTGWACSQSAGVVTCTSPSLTSGSTAPDITVTITVPNVTTMSSTANVSSLTTDPVPANNSKTASTTVNPPTSTSVDLSITKTDSPDPVPLVGNNVTYTITVTNNGPSPATGVTVTDTLNSLTYVSATSSQGTCSGTTTVTCTIGTLSNGATATITIVAGTNPPAGTISNTATVTLNENDSNMVNNSATATTNVGDISRLVGISTRARVETGQYVMVGGFSFGGILPKQILIRGRGPSMSGPPYNFTGTLTNPILEIYSGPTLFAVVDNWQSGATMCNAPAISCGTPAAMQAISVDPCQPNVGQTTAPPGCTQEAAFLITLPPGAYTAKLKGVNDEMGKGIIEVYDPDTSTMPKVEGISTRGKVLTGTDIMVGGFVIGAGNSSKKVLIRGRGPSMSGAPYNFTGTLANPTMEIYSGQTLFATVDDWGTGATMCNAPAILCGTPAELQTASVDPCQPNAGQTTAPPGCNLESALFITLPPGAYTAKLKGVNNGTGIGIVEIYDVP